MDVCEKLKTSRDQETHRDEPTGNEFERYFSVGKPSGGLIKKEKDP